MSSLKRELIVAVVWISFGTLVFGTLFMAIRLFAAQQWQMPLKVAGYAAMAVLGNSMIPYLEEFTKRENDDDDNLE